LNRYVICAIFPRMPDRVLILDGHWRKTLAATRALGNAGVTVTVGESTRLATTMFSRYCHRRLGYPAPLIAPQPFMDALEADLRRHPVDMILPMEDDTVDLLSRHRNRFEPLARVPVTDIDRIDMARRKDNVIQLARTLGIPTPKTWLITSLIQVAQLKNDLSYPVVIKPRIGSGAAGVAYVDGPDKLISAYGVIHRRFPLPMIQERIPRTGAGYGASLLMGHQQETMAVFMHKRLREYPISGGASTLRESVWRDDLKEMAETLLKAMGWTGVAMVEFKEDPRDGRLKLMEVNSRFWGSLGLAIHAGVNFPLRLLDMAMGRSFRPLTKYRLGVRCRWLLHGDILHYLANPGRNRMDPPFFNFFDPDTAYDIISKKDPLPALGRILMPLTLIFDPAMRYRAKQRID